MYACDEMVCRSLASERSFVVKRDERPVQPQRDKGKRDGRPGQASGELADRRLHIIAGERPRRSTRTKRVLNKTPS